MSPRPTCLAVFLILIFAPFAASSSDELSPIRDAYRTTILQGAVSEQTVKRSTAALSPEGTWEDVDYADRTRGGWKPYIHLARTFEAARAWASPASPLHGDAALREKTLTALRHWLAKDYRCPNWWYNEIGVPRKMADVLILLEAELTEEEREKALKIVSRAEFGMTGQNSVWVAEITFVRALIEDDPALAAEARKIVLKDLVVTTKEGLQPDASFHQHGPQQQFGNYGLSFASDMSFWGNVWKGTAMALTPEHIRLLQFYVLDGLTGTVYRGFMDVGSCGRQLHKNSQRSKAAAVINVCVRMEKLDPKRAEIYRKIAAANRKPFPPSGRDEIRNFWRSDYVVQNTPGFFLSLKMRSKRTIGCETCNSENMLGRLLADGTTYIYVDGDEYTNIMPVWNWRRLPGITAVQDSNGSLVPRNKRGTTEFVGGTSPDGTHAAVAMDFSRDSLTAKKAWFFLGDHLVCLGAGIACKKDHPVDTTLNQARLKGDVLIASGEKIRTLRPEEETAAAGATGIWHRRVAYRFFEPTGVLVSAKNQTGDWKRVRRAYPDTPVTVPVFTARLEHGKQPRDAKYAYVVTPDCDSDVAGRLPADRIAMIANDAAVQAVADRRNDRLFAVFHAPGELAYGGQTLRVDRPCVVIVNAVSNADKRRVSVCDPTRKAEAMTLRLGERRERIEFPRGENVPHRVSVAL